MPNKEAIATLRIRFKQAVHQKAPTDSFRLAMMASDALLSAGVPADEALAEAGRWLCAHGKGPSVSDWQALSVEHRSLIQASQSAAQPNARTPDEQRTLFQFTYLMVLGLKNWRRHLKRMPGLFDIVLGTTIPILAQSDAVPVSMKYLLIEQVEEVLAQQNKSPVIRFRLAHLRMMRGRMLLSFDDATSQAEGLLLLRQQEQVLKRLAQQGIAKAAALHQQLTTLLQEQPSAA